MDRYIVVQDDMPNWMWSVLDTESNRLIQTDCAPGWIRKRSQGATAKIAAKLNRAEKETSTTEGDCNAPC